MVHGPRWKVAAGAAALALLFAACGDDDDDDATATTAVADDGGDEGSDDEFEIAAEDEEFCAIASELDAQEDFPTPEQLEEYRAAAPDEIADPVNTVVDAFVAAGDDPFAAFEDPAVGQAFEDEIEPFEAEHCGLHLDDEEDDQDPSVTAPDESAAQVGVTATEYAFALDSAPAAGRTQFTMTNAGQERHVLVVFRIAEGSTLDDVLAAEGEEGIDGPELESAVVPGGGTAVLTTDLEAGDYGMICYIPTPDGTPHLALGMASSFTVA